MIKRSWVQSPLGTIFYIALLHQCCQNLAEIEKLEHCLCFASSCQNYTWRVARGWLTFNLLVSLKSNSWTVVFLKHFEFSFRSLNYGFNPNDDFDLRSLENWLYYSDYNYWEGTILFDSLEDLLEKIMSTNYDEVHKVLEEHRIRNKEKNRENWRSIVRYLADGPKSTIPETFESGMAMWDNKVEPPDFSYRPPKVNSSNASNSWVLLCESPVNEDILSQIDPKLQVLYVISNNITKVPYNLGKKIANHELEILTLNDMKLSTFRTKQNTELHNCTKQTLIGSLFLISKGVTSIQITQVPHRR